MVVMVARLVTKVAACEFFFCLYIFPLLFRTRETETALFQLKISS